VNSFTSIENRVTLQQGPHRRALQRSSKVDRRYDMQAIGDVPHRRALQRGSKGLPPIWGPQGPPLHALSLSSPPQAA